jgi:hypothetical protein
MAALPRIYRDDPFQTPNGEAIHRPFRARIGKWVSRSENRNQYHRSRRSGSRLVEPA